MRAVTGAVLALLAGLVGAAPALAQTDDRILNDLARVYGGINGMERMALLCSDATGQDPETGAAFDALIADSQLIKIAGVSLMATRGTVPKAVLDAAIIAEGETYAAAFATDPDPARTCNAFADDIRDGRVSLSTLYPDEMRRLNGALAGGYPPLDVDASAEVADALAVRLLREETEALLRICGRVLPENVPLYADALAYWRTRNSAPLAQMATVLAWWGVGDARRLELQREAASARMGEVIYGPRGAERCAAFITGLEQGAEDLATRGPDLLARLAGAQGPDPRD